MIFLCAGLLAWTRPLHSALSLVNSNHWSCANKQPATAANFLRPELPFDRREGWMGCRNYVALWIQCFYGDSLRCVVIRERFVYFHIHNFILAFWKPKWISHTNSYSEGHIHVTRSYSYFELGPPVISQAGSRQGDCSAWYSMYICKSPWPSKHSLHGNLSAWLAGILASHCWDPGKLGWDFPI